MHHLTLTLLAAVAALACALPAQAQLRLPSVNLPSVTNLPAATRSTLPAVRDTAQQALPLQELRASAVRDLLRQHADRVEADPAGEPVRRAEVLLVSPPPGALELALSLGFVLLREELLDGLDLRQLVLRVPAGLGTAQAVERLRAIDPALQVDFNHLYTRGGDAAGAASAPAAAGPARARRIGLVDSGVDRRHAAFARAAISTHGCNGAEHASAHGTAVASLLVGRDDGFAGVLPGAALFAADVYCGQPVGGAAEDIARALAWMARERVPVVNLSLVGPANRLLEQATLALLRKGHIVVAAVGNDGPAAPPLYPAAYPGVVGVTGVTPARRVLPEAARGAQVTLAAPGSDLAMARPGGGYVVGRGTSFAAPLVAGLLADALSQPDPERAAAAVAQLARSALDLGEPGRDPVYGFGVVAESVRTPPERVQARLP